MREVNPISEASVYHPNNLKTNHVQHPQEAAVVKMKGEQT